MKNNIKIAAVYSLLLTMIFFTSCEKKLEPQVFDKLAPETFLKNASDAKAALTSLYSGMMGGVNGPWSSGYGDATYSYVCQSMQTTDEGVCSWGGFEMFNTLDFSDSQDQLIQHYFILLPMVTNATILLEKIGAINMDSTLKKRYLAEIKALRAHFSNILYSYYGPVSIVIDPAIAQNPASLPQARPTSDWMVNQIEADYKDAMADLPVTYSSADYGRFTKGACLMGLLKLYMKEKKWDDAINVGNQIKDLETQGVYALIPEYADIFKYGNKQNKEIILAVPCRSDAWPCTNLWLAHVLPGDYVDQSTGKAFPGWGGYKMPWKTYDKFDQSDRRLKVLLAKYPTFGGDSIDVRALGWIGALPVKYDVDPTTGDVSQGTDIIVWRYADALLLLAEAINEVNGPTSDAYSLVNRIRTRAGLADLPAGLSKDQFRDKIMDERLFELWCEGGIRRDDLIRWGKYIQRAIDDGSPFATPNKVLYPLPRKAVDESNGLIVQNPGY
jgi:starch-binding outer membrane protein, SusD/RagB family